MPTTLPPVAVPGEPVLVLSDVDVWYADGPRVLDGVSLTVRAGEHWALLGANGAGKSTLLALAGAQRHPSRGEVTVLGRRLGTVDLRELRRSLGVVDIRLRMPAELTVSDYVGTGATQTVQPAVDRYDDEVRRRVEDALALTGLTSLADRAVGDCSQGERARARVARALVGDPAVLLLDEPAAGLDLPGRADLLAAVESLASGRPSLATVTVAHHLEELPATTTHVALLRAGRLVATGPVSLLGDEAALSATFDRSLRAFRAAGRWYAVPA